MKYLAIPFLFLLSLPASAVDYCQDYKDGVRTYANLMDLAALTPEMDWDQDDISNREELAKGTNPCSNDTAIDSDHDGLIDVFEEKLGKSKFIKLDPKKRDTDGNGVDDLVQLCALQGEGKKVMAGATAVYTDIYPNHKSYFDLAALCGK